MAPVGPLPWIIRPYIGMVVAMTCSKSEDWFACRIALIPRSEMARLIDLVKLSGIVPGSRRSAEQLVTDSLRVHLGP